jgi:AmmeMemoRadiSam system protein A
MSFPSEEIRLALLQWARHAVVEAVSRAQLPADIPQQGIFLERRGVFVTLHVRGRLRGCIGVVESQETLGESIMRCAAGAAIGDPRFSPLQTEELEELLVEISLMSAPVPIHPKEIEIGRHGLMVVNGARRGLLLPQVATEYRLDPQQFLAETCRKAGLPPDAWREGGTQILGFTCEIFSERSPESGR